MRRTFEQYDKDNPHIWQAFIHFANQTRAKGFENYSAKGIFELIRWHTASEPNGETFKVDNNYTPDYAKKLEETNPVFKGFFRHRELRVLNR